MNANLGIFFAGSDDNTVKLWNLNLDDLLARGCNWARDYLKYNFNVSEENRHLCDGVGSYQLSVIRR